MKSDTYELTAGYDFLAAYKAAAYHAATRGVLRFGFLPKMHEAGHVSNSVTH